MEEFSNERIADALGLSIPEIESLQAALADRDAEEALAEFEAVPTAEAEGIGEGATALAAKVSAAAVTLMVDMETGGKAYYEQVYQGRPVWPKEQSGITIGVGYDLGYNPEATFRQDWAVLGTAVLDRFVNAGCIGAHPPGRSQAQMQAIRAQVRDIIISWSTANDVFKAASLPKFALICHRALPNCDLLHGDCFGALVALTYNRGPSFDKEGDRYREMRAIKAALRDRAFTRIPSLLRSMIRIWIGKPIETQMHRVRNAEAALFEAGLAAMAAEPLAPSIVEEAAVATAESPSDASDEETFADITEEEALAAEAAAAEAEATGDIIFEAAARGAVHWAPDDLSPDYAHIASVLPVGLPFQLKPEDLALLCRLNDFPIEETDATPVLFGLRGTTIVSGGSAADGSWRTEVTLKDVRPDHKSTRCTMGLWQLGEKKLAVFPGSTTPNAQAMIDWRNTRVHGNILATGSYGYIVGVHNGKPGCFLLRERVDKKRRVVVRRSSDDLAYDLGDLADSCTPGDNIHPTFGTSESFFSSVGCQVVMGMANTSGNHSGPWARFRAMAGLTTPTGTPGKAYRYLLFTGREAMLAADLRKNGLAGDTPSLRSLRRLRFGSQGEAVSRLQAKLGIAEPDGDFGPVTASLLYKMQAESNGGRADGIYTPALDEKLGWGVFSTAGV